MKQLLATIAGSAFVFAASAVGIFTPVGPATLKLDAITQATPFTLVAGKTNQTATSTNITVQFKATTATVPFDGAAMLALLENSFNTNFPAGSKIGMRFGSLFVVDSTGINVIFTPTGVISFQFDEEFIPATETDIITQNASGFHESGNLKEILTTSATLNYDDTVNTTKDGTHTKFAFKGFYTVSVSENFKTGLTKTTSVFQGTGGGPVRGVDTILTGTITGKATGTPVF